MGCRPMDELTLPEGLTSRPLTVDDAEAVFSVMALQEQEDIGKVEIELADIVGDWQKPSFDVGRLDRGRLRRRPAGGLRRGQQVRPR